MFANILISFYLSSRDEERLIQLVTPGSFAVCRWNFV